MKRGRGRPRKPDEELKRPRGPPRKPKAERPPVERQEPPQEPPQAYAQEEPAHEQIFKLARLFGSRLADFQQEAKHVKREKTRSLIRNNLLG